MSSLTRLSVCLLFLASVLSAQFSGAIQGTVVDSSQSVIPDALVTATDVATGITRQVKTSKEGFYRISNLAPGIYNVRAEMSGFSASLLEGLEVDVTSTVKADFTMALGTVSESVSVKAEAPL